MTLSLENFPQADSLVHRLDPRWKLASLIPAVFVIVLVKSLLAALACLGCTFVVVLFSRLPLSWFARRLAALSVLLTVLALTAPFLIRSDGSSIQIGPLDASLFGLIFGVTAMVKALAIA